jgi:ABC-type bacteriocin/lantibiotic exporter with double-glycine peptidase domain
MQTIKNFLYLFTYHEIKRVALLMIMILIMALLETVGVLSILPFIAVLSNPNLIQTNSILNYMFEFSKIFGVQNNYQFLLVLGVLVFLILVISLCFKSLTTYAQHQFIQMREYTIGTRLVKLYLRQPYNWFLNRHSSDLGKNILSEVQAIVGNGLNPLIELFAKGSVAIAIILLLIMVDIKLALIVGLALGGAYSVIFFFLHSSLNQIGEKRLKNNQLRFKALNEAFGAVKDIKIRNIEKIYIDRFANPAKIYAKTTAYSQVVKHLPRFALEAIAFGGAMLLILYLMLKKGNFNDALPVIALYIFAGYRLIPSLQQVFSSLTQITFVNPALNSLIDDIKSLSEYIPSNKKLLFLNKKISLKNIQFHYPKSSRIILRNINLEIKAKSIVGLVGPTGSGKTTIVDIILGLLEAQKGTFEVDGQVINKENQEAWRQSIGYVPQNIYLTDDTIAANIAFGVDEEEIDKEKIEKASKIANLHKFIENDLDQKYQTKIGERGVKLSGGQKQRIGIARALYHKPELLVLDEATSALDSQTEHAVMDTLNNIGKEITIILIAHRLSTVKICDEIYKLENGELKQRLFEELIEENEKLQHN